MLHEKKHKKVFLEYHYDKQIYHDEYCICH